MNVLLTNDDGIEAEGLQALRRALVELPDVDLAVIAPDGNRSATARSITTRRPLWVEEVDFGDGTVGYATDGTPVDCVRLARLGLIDGFEADLVVSGINHGSNLGDDITYSGTVAAALEGSCSACRASPSRSSRTRASSTSASAVASTSTPRRPSRRASSSELEAVPLPAGTLLNDQRARPASPTASRSRGWASASTATSSSWRARRTPAAGGAYRIYGEAPEHVDEDGHRPRRGRGRAHRGHAAPLRPDRPRRAWTRCAASTSRGCCEPAAKEIE